MNIIAPSMLACDFGNLKSEIDMVNNSKGMWPVGCDERERISPLVGPLQAWVARERSVAFCL